LKNLLIMRKFQIKCEIHYLLIEQKIKLIKKRQFLLSNQFLKILKKRKNKFYIKLKNQNNLKTSNKLQLIIKIHCF